MNCTLVVVGLLRDYADASSTVPLPAAGATVEEVMERLAIPPDLVAIVLVNGRQRPKCHLLTEGDVVKLVPLMGGG